MSLPSDEAVLAALEQNRIACAPVLSVEDTLAHPYFKARQMVRTVTDPILGEVTIPGFPLKFSVYPDLPDLQAPLLGQHQRAGVAGVSELFGYGDRPAATEWYAVSRRSVEHARCGLSRVDNRQ